ncbi:MAG: AsnC family transcriptional regulator [Candidatus Woesearchaeota archaeon]
MSTNLLKIDLLDKKILYALEIDARTPLTILAKKVRSSPAVVEYRLRRMQESGLIKNYITFLDAGKLGLMVWNVYLELQNTTKKEEDELVAYLCNLKETWWVGRCSGKWSIIYSICVRDIKEFYVIATQVNNKFGKYILNQSIAAHAEIEIISRGYFLDKPGIGKTWYNTIKKAKLDETDIKILRVLSENARMPSTEIARKTKLTARIVAYRIKELVASGIIHRFRPQIDVKKIGMSFYKVIVHLKEYTHQKNTQLKEYCVMQGNIFHYEQKIGPWMLELELDAQNYESADRQLRTIKEQFPDFIRSYELLLITDEPKGGLDLTKQL